ncbi:GNAT family N-acetyltransferase, partial [candidate division WOR-3 bacterium]|nr:GNAT family N-acetyltransferase [candidate division WOR-3 bacterium]
MAGTRIRPYVQGQDDEVLLSILNASWADSPDFVPLTIEMYRVDQQAPDWTADGKFLAEVEGTPVGTASGHVDPKRKDPVGQLGGPSVVPEFRRRGIGTALVGQALHYLRSQGLERVRSGAADWNQAGTAFLKKLGFEPVRRFSEMRRPLAGLPSGIGENRAAAIETVGTSDEEIAVVVRLSNEAFREHFGRRELAVEQSAFWARNAESAGYVMRYTLARLEGEPVGYLLIGYSPRDNEQLNAKRAGLWSLGVLKPYRNRGIAKALMLEGMHWLSGQGLDEA